MVKTKRSTARTALFASASVLLAAHGADAVINFAGAGNAADAFANSATADCADLWFIDSSGLLTTDAIGSAAPTTHSQGLAVNKAGLTGAPTDFSECKVAPGYYLSAKATSAADGTALKILPTPANFFSAASSTVEVLTYAATAGTWDGSTATALAGTGVTACPTNSGTGSATGKSSMTDCVTSAGYYLKKASDTAGSVVIEQAPAGWRAAGGVPVVDPLYELDVAAASLTASHSSELKKIEICDAGRWSAAGASGCTDCGAGKYSPTVGATAISACLACPANTYGEAANNAECTACPSFSGVATVAATSTGNNARTDCTAELTVAQADEIYADGGAEALWPVFITATSLSSGGKLQVAACPTGSISDAFAATGWRTSDGAGTGGFLTTVPATKCGVVAAGYSGTDGNGGSGSYSGHAPASGSLSECDDNSTSEPFTSNAGGQTSPTCHCVAGYYAVGSDCVALPAAAAAASPTAPTADSAGASTPIAVALAAAAAVPLLL